MRRLTWISGLAPQMTAVTARDHTRRPAPCTPWRVIGHTRPIVITSHSGNENRPPLTIGSRGFGLEGYVGGKCFAAIAGPGLAWTRSATLRCAVLGEEHHMTATRWDDIEILQTIDRLQEQMDGRLLYQSGYDLAKEVTGTQWVDPERMPGFINELHLAYQVGHIIMRLADNVQPSNASYYLQQIRDISLTTEGRDRARGRVVFQPLPDPAEDDNRKISDLIFRRIAEAIHEQDDVDDVASFLADEDIPPPAYQLPEDVSGGDAYRILTGVWRWGSEGRRGVRRFIGRWLDDRLLSGPDPEVRALVIDQLARQGWSVRESDSMLVISEPVRGVPVTASYLRSSRLHALVDAKARKQFLIKKPDQAVFASMKAVEVRVRKLGGFTDQDFGVDLMNKAFGPTGPLTDRSAGKGERICGAA
jgi:hypothetical protein